VTNFPDDRSYPDLVPEGDTEAARLASDLDSLYAADVPDLPFEYRPQPAHLPSFARRIFRRPCRPALAVAAAAAVLAAVLIAPGLGRDGTAVSAEEILERTNSVAATNAPLGAAPAYHLVAAQSSSIATTPGEDSITTTTETWYADADHFRTEYRSGGRIELGQALAGDDAWLYTSGGSGLRVAHGPSSALGQTTAVGSTAGVRSLADVLNQYGDVCRSARLQGEETLLDRPVHVIVVAPSPDSCPPDDPKVEKARALGEYMGTMTVWVDKETFLPLKTEQHDGQSDVVYRYTVVEIQVGLSIPAATFTYEPPDGVVVQEVATLTEAKDVISGVTPETQDETCPPPPDDASQPEANVKDCPASP